MNGTEASKASTPSQGTEWTEPGQGATIKELQLAMQSSGFHVSQTRIAYRNLSAICKIDGLLWISNPTNLRLTGHPLTSIDLTRIAEAK